MKFTVSSSLLNRHLTKVSGVLMNNPIIPILDCFLLEIKENILTITASDMQTSVTTSLQITILEHEETCDDSTKIAVPAKLLLETIKSILEQPITIKLDNSTYGISIISSNGVYRLVGENATDFPKITISDRSNEIRINNNVLKSMLSTTLVTTSKDELKPSIGGVYASFNEIGVTFVATDGYKLARYIRYDIKYDKGATAFIIPRKTIYTLIPILSGEEEAVVILFEENYIQATIGNTVVTARLINERFPPYDNVIPKGNDKIVVMNRLELLRSLRRISIFANKSTKYVGLNLGRDEIEVFAEDRDFSNEARESVLCEYSGATLTLGFNVTSLIDLLSSIQCEEVEIQLSEPNRACLIIPKQMGAAESILLLIMPMLPPSS
jgi:DNA polymerase-3 subunit beta